MSAPDRVLVLGGPTGAMAELVADSETIDVVEDVQQGLSRLDGDATPGLVVVDASWPQPLAAVRTLRRAHGSVGLAVVCDPATAEPMRGKLAFLPDAGEVAVVAAHRDPERLRRQLEEVAGSFQQRQRVRGALDAINRDLSGPASPAGQDGRTTSVSEHYLAALVRHAADTIVSIDPSGRLVTINDAGQRTLGLDPSVVEGRHLHDLLATDDPGELDRMLRGAAAGRVQDEDDLLVHLAEGPRLTLSATAAPVVDDAGAIAGLVLIARDVTAERAAEQRLQALQKAETLATLASGVAHDFNNLLVQVQGWADLAGEDPSDTALVSSALENIGRATRQASELARAMLAYGGRGEFELTTLDLGRLVADLEPLLAASLPTKIRLSVELAETPQLRADATQLRQVLLNLVTNAGEAIGDSVGAVTVQVFATSVADGEIEGPHQLPDGRYAVLEVADTGPGIDAEHRGRLFDPFYTTKFTGRGLGLAASQGIARAHGGVLALDSGPGEGARFRLYLPTT